ncbi:hypothetical protein SBOR_4880 [Sclerotinia borealis F-4128]|uniref:Uncharacterized protein n=1 Tax=Sclerotinia borealis (strain F-4128) TaxID=1432307 RepID=W9CFT4_SCLBF|nr:hypothetical protein SBOR_4880 [Sclerotinia borealis F-4128]
MELSKSGSRNIPDEKSLASTKVHTSKSGSRTILGERKFPSPEDDAIMSDGNYTHDTNIYRPYCGLAPRVEAEEFPEDDTILSDENYTDADHTSDTTIRRPYIGLALEAPAPQRRYVPAPRRHQGVLDPKYVAEDAAFFARANRQYHQKIQEVVREDEMKNKEDMSATVDKWKSTLTAKTKAAPDVSKDPNFIDVFWDGERNEAC